MKKELCLYIGGYGAPLANSTLYDWINKKGFPKPIHPFAQFPLWDKVAVDNWIKSFAAIPIEKLD
ncbi:MAG: AlpA family phage regulatory protein [Burkholderiales bacterium]|nr:AlpA family phage regulatory protein [Burkholderiales bacterium]